MSESGNEAGIAYSGDHTRPHPWNRSVDVPATENGPPVTRRSSTEHRPSPPRVFWTLRKRVDSARNQIRARARAIVTDTMAANPAPSASSPMSLLGITLTGPESPISSSTPEPATDSASPGSTDWDAHSGSCSKPSTVSRPAASTWSASRNASISPRRSANSCSNSSARWGNSRHRPSPSGPTTASRRPEDEMGKLGVRRSIRTRFRRRRIPRSRSVARKTGRTAGNWQGKGFQTRD